MSGSHDTELDVSEADDGHATVSDPAFTDGSDASTDGSGGGAARTGAEAVDTSYDLSPGDVVDGRFEVDRHIGAGGMGDVYMARQLNVDRPVALKLLKRDRVQDDRAVEQFLAEAAAISRLTSPHTVTLHDVGQVSDGSPFIAMELLEGRTLRGRLARGSVGRREALRILDGIALSLAEAHARGIVHRDVKPSNVMLTKTPGHRSHVKVLDFGLARLAEAEGRRMRVAGTPLYMAPEALLEGVISPRTDIYALGMVAYELFAGSHPFAGLDRDDLIEAQLTTVPPPLDEVVEEPLPSKLVGLIARCLAKGARLRPKDAGVFRRALRDALDLVEEEDEQSVQSAAELNLPMTNTTVGPTAGPRSTPKPAPTNRRWMVVGLALTALAAFTVNRFLAQPVVATAKPVRPFTTSIIIADRRAAVPPASASAVPTVTLPPTSTASSQVVPTGEPVVVVPKSVASVAPSSTRPAAPKTNRCAEHWVCAQKGKCTEKDGKCVLASSADCRMTTDCKSFGYCTLVGGACVAGSDADCLGSPSCASKGMCKASGGVCKRTSAGCASSWDCKFHGACALGAQERCTADSAAKCAASGGCKKNGNCSLIRNGCRAGSDADCKQSSVCREYGKCKLLGEICLKR